MQRTCTGRYIDWQQTSMWETGRWFSGNLRVTSRTAVSLKPASCATWAANAFSQRTLAYFLRGSITVQLTSCLTGLDSTKQVNMLLSIQPRQSI